MGARFQSLLLSLGPVRRAVQDEITRAMEPTIRSAREAHDTHRDTLRARDRLIASLREDNEDLRKHNDDGRRRIAELEVDNEDLRARLAAAREAVEQRKAVRQQPGERTISDLFRCLDCSSVWLLSTSPDQIRTVRRPVGDGCDNCAKEPLRHLQEIKTILAKPGTATEVAPQAVHNNIAWCATEIDGTPDGIAGTR